MTDLQEAMARLVDATGVVWQMRQQAEEEVRNLRSQLEGLTRSYGQLQRQNEQLRIALQDILDLQNPQPSTAVQLIAKMALHPQA